MTHQSLRAFVEQVARSAAWIFQKQGELSPMYHAINRQGEDLIFPAPPVDKQASLAIVRAILAEAGATRVAFLGEGWMLDTKATNADIDQVMRDGVAAHPQRIEVLLISVEDALEGLVLARRTIIRKGKKVKLGPLEIQSTSSAEGRMVGLLPPTGSIQ